MSTMEAYELDEVEVIGTFKRWSASAIQCHARKAKCEGCYYESFFASRPYGCKMYLAVDQLLNTLGEPSENLLNKFS
ncbi:MAG: hypothetical protein AAGI66_09890 [Cyanobacteria bacterium P01_H01_bin.74]